MNTGGPQGRPYQSFSQMMMKLLLVTLSKIVG